MRRVLFEIFDAPVHAYPFFFVAAVLVGTVLLLMPKVSGSSLSPFQILFLVFSVVIGGVFGARLFFVIQFRSPLYTSLNIGSGGLAFYGGLGGGCLAALLFSWKTRLPVLSIFDTLAPAMLLGESFARIGCFFNGCCWGRPCDLPWAVRFPPGSPLWKREVLMSVIGESEPFSLYVHPAQLYMSLLMLFSFILLLLFFRSRGVGFMFCGYLALHGGARFIIEFFRDDTARIMMGLTLYQCIALTEFLCGLGAFVWFVWRNTSRASKSPTDA